MFHTLSIPDLSKIENGKGLGIDTIMEVMVEEFKKLENGVTHSNGKTILLVLAIIWVSSLLGD